MSVICRRDIRMRYFCLLCARCVLQAILTSNAVDFDVVDCNSVKCEVTGCRYATKDQDVINRRDVITVHFLVAHGRCVLRPRCWLSKCYTGTILPLTGLLECIANDQVLRTHHLASLILLVYWC